MDEDRVLVNELKNGSHKAFQQVYDHYNVRIYSFILSMVPSHDEAREIFQQVFVKIWENSQHINPEYTFSTYIFTIARNSVYDYWRRGLNQRQLENYLGDDSNMLSVKMEDSISSKDFLAYLTSVVNQLPERRKEIFKLRFFHHLSYREIASKLGISVSTVDNQLQKALKIVREKVKNEPFFLFICLYFIL